MDSRFLGVTLVVGDCARGRFPVALWTEVLRGRRHVFVRVWRRLLVAGASRHHAHRARWWER